MLRVGLTGELASGKSTVANMLAGRGALVLSSDDMARAMMQPPHPVFDEIVAHFGPEVLTPSGTLDRRKLAALAFDPISPRIAELNAIIHPPVLAAQAEQIAKLAHTDAIVVVESALLLNNPAWRDRFDSIIFVTAPRLTKIARYVARATQANPHLDRSDLEADAVRRMAQQPTNPPPGCLLISNTGAESDLAAQINYLWQRLRNSQLSTHHS